ncbi:hypothetical protein K1719_042389 [Acacia pycnantha]|nr:hypothetical protein K1719_042389 [Acacia pycnantha]
MNSAIRCAPSSSPTFSAFSSRKLSLRTTKSFYTLPSRQNVDPSTNLSVSYHKPLHISSTENFSLVAKTRKRGFECEAYEADKSGPLEITVDEEARVTLAHSIGHVVATMSMSKVAVSFTHIIIKSVELAFSVLVLRFFLGESFPMPVYLSLVPIIGGYGLAALIELNFNMIGFMGAMMSNLAFVFRNISSKKGMKGMYVSGMNYYACLSMMSMLILIPFAIVVEGPQMWAIGWQTALSQIGPNFVWEHNEGNFGYRLFHYYLSRASPTRQCPQGRLCRSRYLHLFTGCTKRNSFGAEIHGDTSVCYKFVCLYMISLVNLYFVEGDFI